MKLFNLIHPFFFRKKQANESKKNIASPDLIVLLSRYGDNAISLRVLREIFGSHISNVRIVTSRQFAPYITEIFPDASIYQLNPNHGLFGILQLLSSLSLQPPERAYNPWSYGDIPRKLISYAIRSENYANLSFPTELNWYSRVYQYFKKPTPVALSPDNNYNLLKTAKRIHIAPFSTDNKRSLPADSIRSLIEAVQILNPLVDIEISGLPPQLAGLQSQFLSHSVSIHTLHRTAAASEHFINALRSCDLLITVDTGPLHIADLLDVPSIAFFGPSNPDSVLHPITKSMPIRPNIMRGSICMADCDNPLCLRAALDLFLKNDFDVTIRATPIHTIVDQPCHYLDQASVKLP